LSFDTVEMQMVASVECRCVESFAARDAFAVEIGTSMV
jgi:hypothetical protein